MRLVFLGPPGAGKGTQAGLLQRKYRVPQLSTGEMLRHAVASDSPVGREAKAVMEAGELVSDDTMNAIVSERIDEADCALGFVLDGYPRTRAQAEALDKMLGDRSLTLDAVLELKVDVDALVARVSGRYACAKCGTGYHDRFKPPKQPGVCDVCGSTDFIRRPDDRPETVRARLEAFERQTAPLLPYYRDRNLLREIDGMQAIDDVTRQIEAALTELPS